MTTYRVSPQCPASGLPVDITYVAGRLNASFDERWCAKTYGPDAPGQEISAEDWAETLALTRGWIARVHRHRAHSVDEAQAFLEREGLHGDYLEPDGW